jgi:redox-sensitive bicupin YhaK (pirin superfamily)
MSPSDLGQVVKPFVFLDLFEADIGQMRRSMPLHPHSGIATVTVFTNVRFDDPDAGKGMIAYGGVEFLLAGGGAPHRKFARLIRTIRSRISRSIRGRPPRQWPREQDAQMDRKP